MLIEINKLIDIIYYVLDDFALLSNQCVQVFNVDSHAFCDFEVLNKHVQNL